MQSVLILIILFDLSLFTQSFCIKSTVLFDLSLYTHSVCIKIIYSRNCTLLREGSSDIASFVESSVYSISKMYSVLILVFYFDLPPLIQSACVKVKFSGTSRCSAKEAVILPRSRSTLYIAFQSVKVPDSGCCT